MYGSSREEVRGATILILMSCVWFQNGSDMWGNNTDTGADTDTDAEFGALVSTHTPVYCPVRLHAVCCIPEIQYTLNDMVTVL